MELYDIEESKQAFTHETHRSTDSNDDPPQILSRKQRQKLTQSVNQSTNRPTSAEMLEIVQANHKDNFGMNQLTHWDEHLMRERIRQSLHQTNQSASQSISRSTDPAKLRALFTPEKPESKLLSSMNFVNKFKEPSPMSPAVRPISQSNNQNQSINQSIGSLQNVDPSRLSKLGAAVLSLASKYEVPKEIEGISTQPDQSINQSINQSVSQSDLNEFNFNFQTEDSIDRTFLTSVPEINQSTNQSVNPVKSSKSWFDETDVDTLIHSLAKSINQSALPNIPFPQSYQSVEEVLQSIILNTQSINQLPSGLIDLATSDLSLSIIQTSFFYFLLLILGYDRDLINYAQWSINQKKYEEHLAEMEALNRINQSINQSNNRTNRQSTKGTTRYTYYDSVNDVIDEKESPSSPSMNEPINQSINQSDIRPPTVVLPPAPFRPQQSPLSLMGPQSINQSINQLLPVDHKQRTQLNLLIDRLSIDYLQLFPTVSPSMIDCLISLYYDVIAETLYNCYVSVLPQLINQLNTPIFRQRLVKSTCALFTGYVSANCNSHHWKINQSINQSNNQSINQLNNPSQSNSQLTNRHSNLPYLEPGVPLLMTRKTVSINHSPLINQFFINQAINQKHLRLSINLSLSFPMILSKEVIDLSAPVPAPSLVAMRAKYEKDKLNELIEERQSINQSVAFKQRQAAELVDALNDRRKFASKLVEQCQSDKYGGLKMQSKQLALKRLNHLRMST